jgi:hypothetical protein
VCKAGSNFGEACDARTAPCVIGTVCAPDGKCSLPLGAGAACTDAWQCVTASCTSAQCDAPLTVRQTYCTVPSGTDAGTDDGGTGDGSDAGMDSSTDAGTDGAAASDGGPSSDAGAGDGG